MANGRYVLDHRMGWPNRGADAIEPHPFQLEHMPRGVMHSQPYATRLAGLGGFGAELSPAEKAAADALAKTGKLPLPPKPGDPNFIGPPDPSKSIPPIAWLLLIAAAFIFYKTVTQGKNPGPNTIARVKRGKKGWYYQLVRKGAAKHGLFASREDAKAEAECKGYHILS